MKEQTIGTTSLRIILIGFMGSGKSSVATCLAKQLVLPLFEMDKLIIQRSGLSSIAQIFSECGEGAFRDLETSTAEELQSVVSGIISTGGGVVTRERNRALLHARPSTFVFLKTSFQTVSARVADLADRPLFSDRVKAEELFYARAPLYESWADLTVVTDQRSPEAVCEEIIHALQGSQ